MSVAGESVLDAAGASGAAGQAPEHGHQSTGVRLVKARKGLLVTAPGGVHPLGIGTGGRHGLGNGCFHVFHDAVLGRKV